MKGQHYPTNQTCKEPQIYYPDDHETLGTCDNHYHFKDTVIDAFNFDLDCHLNKRLPE